MKDDFWGMLSNLVTISRLVIDRPKNSCHPRYPELVYPLDYGYLEGTSSADGGGIDVWLGSAEDRKLSGIILTVDMKKRDSEIKILLGCNDEEIQIILAFHNDRYMRSYLVRKPSENNE